MLETLEEEAPEETEYIEGLGEVGREETKDEKDNEEPSEMA